MRLGVWLCVCLLILPVATAAKVYQGSEAAALRCAAILSVIPSAAARAGEISQKDVRIFHVASAVIITRYVSGDERQRQRAFTTVMQRYTAEEHLRDFHSKAGTCLRQFPIR